MKEQKPGLCQNVSQISTKCVVVGNKCIFGLSRWQVQNSRAASSRWHNFFHSAHHCWRKGHRKRQKPLDTWWFFHYCFPQNVTFKFVYQTDSRNSEISSPVRTRLLLFLSAAAAGMSCVSPQRSERFNLSNLIPAAFKHHHLFALSVPTALICIYLLWIQQQHRRRKNLFSFSPKFQGFHWVAFYAKNAH